MKPYKPQIIPASEITPKALFDGRRKFMQLAGSASLAVVWPHQLWAGEKLANVKNQSYLVHDELTPLLLPYFFYLTFLYLMCPNREYAKRFHTLLVYIRMVFTQNTQVH